MESYVINFSLADRENVVFRLHFCKRGVVSKISHLIWVQKGCEEKSSLYFNREKVPHSEYYYLFYVYLVIGASMPQVIYLKTLFER